MSVDRPAISIRCFRLTRVFLDDLYARGRLNPDRIIVGEVIGDEIIAMLDAMTRGNHRAACTWQLADRSAAHAASSHHASRGSVFVCSTAPRTVTGTCSARMCWSASANAVRHASTVVVMRHNGSGHSEHRQPQRPSLYR
jgi:hypothetical protein